MWKYRIVCIVFICLALGCNSQHGNSTIAISKEMANDTICETSINTIHLFVALCDNQYQGIVPVPPKIGNGQDPNNNLYWGCAFGVRTYFKNSKEWNFISSVKCDSLVLERIIFKHKTQNYYLIADAYDGQFIKKCTQDFLKSTSGQLKNSVIVKDKKIGIYGNAKMLGYIGHDGLMDFNLDDKFVNHDGKKRDVMILACYGKRYFSPHLVSANVNPIIWSSGLMSPEAYTVHDALSGYLKNESNEEIRMRAANAYSKFQKCSVKAAKNLLLTSW